MRYNFIVNQADDNRKELLLKRLQNIFECELEKYAKEFAEIAKEAKQAQAKTDL